jgi:hypothetical protein
MSYPDDTVAGILRCGHDCYVVNLSRLLVHAKACVNCFVMLAQSPPVFTILGGISTLLDQSSSFPG